MVFKKTPTFLLTREKPCGKMLKDEWRSEMTVLEILLFFFVVVSFFGALKFLGCFSPKKEKEQFNGFFLFSFSMLGWLISLDYISYLIKAIEEIVE